MDLGCSCIQAACSRLSQSFTAWVTFSDMVCLHCRLHGGSSKDNRDVAQSQSTWVMQHAMLWWLIGSPQKQERSLTYTCCVLMKMAWCNICVLISTCRCWPCSVRIYTRNLCLSVLQWHVVTSLEHAIMHINDPTQCCCNNKHSNFFLVTMVQHG